MQLAGPPRRGRDDEAAGGARVGHTAGMSNWIGRGVGVVLVLIGGLWVLQGIGLVGGSFMTGSTVYAVLGLVVMASGVATLVPWRRRRPERRR